MTQPTATAFASSSDAPAARQVCAEDDVVDELRGKINQWILRQIRRQPQRAEAWMAISSLARHFERLADLATNIAEDVVFLVEGKSIKHHAEDTGDAVR